MSEFVPEQSMPVAQAIMRGAMDNAQGLSDSHINSFLDESAEAGGVDARVTQPAPQRGMSTTDTERPHRDPTRDPPNEQNS